MHFCHNNIKLEFKFHLGMKMMSGACMGLALDVEMLISFFKESLLRLRWSCSKMNEDYLMEFESKWRFFFFFLEITSNSYLT